MVSATLAVNATRCHTANYRIDLGQSGYAGCGCVDLHGDALPVFLTTLPRAILPAGS
jgi:hypothetical protein